MKIGYRSRAFVLIATVVLASPGCSDGKVESRGVQNANCPYRGAQGVREYVFDQVPCYRIIVGLEPSGWIVPPQGTRFTWWSPPEQRDAVCMNWRDSSEKVCMKGTDFFDAGLRFVPFRVFKETALDEETYIDVWIGEVPRVRK